MSYGHRSGFTLVELLVVIAVIVILLALLVPGLERALRAAERANCMVNQRSVVQSLGMYVLESKGVYPNANIGPYDMGLGVPPPVIAPLPVQLPGPLGILPPPPPVPTPPPAVSGNPFQYATDLMSSNYTTQPLGIGLMVANGQLPRTQLGKLVHCPSLDTTSSATPKFGMDEVYAAGVGASWLDDPAQASKRKIGSYHYRGVSYSRTHSGAALRKHHTGSTFVLYCDLLDRNFGINSHHRTGYNRAFGDGSAAFFQDADQVVENFIASPPPGGNNRPINGIDAADLDEQVFELISRG